MWEVLVLFLTPFGGGIPAGVVLAQKYELAWPLTAFLYFVSDIVLALVFEPAMLWFLMKSETVPALARVRVALAQTMAQLVSRYGLNPGPFSLILISFGADPMTGRVMAKAAGHGFFTGWALVITGDMVFFALVMASTLWLNNVLGDGTWAAVIVTAALLIGPLLIKQARLRLHRWRAQ